MIRQQRSRRNGIAGFTLIEALIATALMAMILAALATITAQWMPNWNRGIARVQRDEDLARGLDRLVADVAAAEFVPITRQTLRPYFNGASHSVTFVRTALSPNAPPGLEIVRFAEDNDANRPVLVRTRAPFLPVVEDRNDREQPHFSDPVALVGAPYRIWFSYAGIDRVWRDTWQNEPLLPRAVRITLRDLMTGRALPGSTATLLRVDAPADCINAKSFADCLISRRPKIESGDSGTSRGPSGGQPS
jgi:general secretion pathway protein J